MEKLDKTRLSLEFEKCKSRGCGKTLHKIVRSLSETDLGENIILVIPSSHLMSFYIHYILSVAKEMDYEIKDIKKDKIVLDNLKFIELIPFQLYFKKKDFYNHIKDITVIFDS